MHLGFEFSRTAAKPKQSADDAPAKEPMRGSDLSQRRKPSADQKKARRQMARQQRKTATSENPIEESNMSRQREVEILRAMAKADLPEQRRLAHELENLRAAQASQVQADRELDLASTVIRDTLTPVRVHEHHTASTDWLTEQPTTGGAYDHAMRTEASVWFGKVHEAVKADVEEFSEQARGMARRLAGAYGEDAPAAEQAFLDAVARMHTLAGGQDDLRAATDEEQDAWTNGYVSIPGAVETEDGLLVPEGFSLSASARTAGDSIDPNAQSGNAESTVTDYDREGDDDPQFSEDWPNTGETGVHPPMPGAGENVTSASTKTATDRDWGYATWSNDNADWYDVPDVVGDESPWSKQTAQQALEMSVEERPELDGDLVVKPYPGPGTTASRKVAAGPIQVKVIQPDGSASVQTIDGSLDSFQSLVGGDIEMVPTNDGGSMYIHEDGKAQGLQPNPTATALVTLFPGDYIAGPAVLTGGVDANGDDLSFTGAKTAAFSTGDRVQVQVGSTDRGTGEIVGTDGGSGVALLYKVKLDSGDTISVADTNLKKTSARKTAALSWGPAGRFPGMPDLGSVSAPTPNGGSVMVAPDPYSGKVEVVYFSPNGSSTLLFSDSGSIEAGKAEVEARIGDISALGSKTASDSVEVSVLPECDIHKYTLGTPGVPAAYDGKTQMGPWANMCEDCFSQYGVGLGTGQGQRLVLTSAKTAEYGYEPCPVHPGQSYNKSTGDCSCGSNHRRWASPYNPDGMKSSAKTAATPGWLSERVNDPYGTPNKAYDKDKGEYYDHPFWAANPPEVVGRYKIIQKDGLWYGYDTSQNMWTVGFPDKQSVVDIANEPKMDMWASKTAAGPTGTSPGDAPVINEGSGAKNLYGATWKGKWIGVEADTTLAAQTAAAAYFGAKKSYEVTVMLSGPVGGDPVVHDPAVLGSMRTRADAQNGNADSTLVQVEVGNADETPMWPWELNDQTQTSGAADVANVATPGANGYPQPKQSSLPIPSQGRISDFRARVEAGLARLEATQTDPTA